MEKQDKLAKLFLGIMDIRMCCMCYSHVVYHITQSVTHSTVTQCDKKFSWLVVYGITEMVNVDLLTIRIGIW